MYSQASKAAISLGDGKRNSKTGIKTGISLSTRQYEKRAVKLMRWQPMGQPGNMLRIHRIWI